MKQIILLFIFCASSWGIYRMGRVGDYYVIDDKKIALNTIKTSISSGEQLENAIKSVLTTNEISKGDWELYIHIYDKAEADFEVMMCKKGLYPGDTWWHRINIPTKEK